MPMATAASAAIGSLTSQVRFLLLQSGQSLKPRKGLAMTQEPNGAGLRLMKPPTSGVDLEGLRKLLSDWWAPPADLVDTLPKAGMQLKYLSHVWVSRALTEADPAWTWQPMSVDSQGQPVIERDSQGHPVGLWITLHVCGTTIPGYGSVEPGKRDAIKELIGDALRNAAMRRGVAGSLWTKDKPAKKKPAKQQLPAAVERNLQHLREQVDEVEDENPHQEKAAGKEIYDGLIEHWGEELVNGALATHKIARFSELTPTNAKVIEASLKARARLEKEASNRKAQLDKEQSK